MVKRIEHGQEVVLKADGEDVKYKIYSSKKKGVDFAVFAEGKHIGFIKLTKHLEKPIASISWNWNLEVKGLVALFDKQFIQEYNGNNS